MFLGRYILGIYVFDFEYVYLPACLVTNQLYNLTNNKLKLTFPNT